jgi:glucans biosynthesis protein C
MTGARHMGMDWLRIGAFGLLIFYHIGMYFVPWPWHVKIVSPINWVAIPMLASNAWRLALLFLVSGYASAALFSKMGKAGPFMRSRTVRLLIPLVFAVIFIIPPQPWIELTGQHGLERGFISFWLNDYFRFGTLNGIVLPTWQHLWFVAYLWIYTMLAALVVAAVPAGGRAWIADRAVRLLDGAWLLILPFAAWLAILLLFPGHEPTHALVDDGPAHLHYLIPFATGWLLRVRPSLFGSVARSWRAALALAAGALAVVAWIEWHWPGRIEAPTLAAPLFATAHLAYGWAAIIALVGFADRYWNVDHRLRAPLAEAIFPFYIIHQTVIVVAGWYLRQSGAGALTSFVTLVVVTAVACWLFYRGGRSISWMRPLIGLAGANGQAMVSRRALLVIACPAATMLGLLWALHGLGITG